MVSESLVDGLIGAPWIVSESLVDGLIGAP